MKNINPVTRQNKTLIISICVFAAVFIFLQLRKPKTESVKRPAPAAVTSQPDTMIPYGYVLIPITVANPEALKALIDRYALVDLYADAGHDIALNELVASKVKLFQAPLNSEQYAVLVAENDSAKIMKYKGAFRVAVQARTTATVQEKKIENTPAQAPAIRTNTNQPLIEYQQD